MISTSRNSIYFCHHRGLFLMLLIICKPSDLVYSQLYFKGVLTFRILNLHCAKKFIFRVLHFFNKFVHLQYSDGDSGFKVLCNVYFLQVFKMLTFHQRLFIVIPKQLWNLCVFLLIILRHQQGEKTIIRYQEIFIGEQTAQVLCVKLGNLFFHFLSVHFICHPKVEGNKRQKKSRKIGIEDNDLYI